MGPKGKLVLIEKQNQHPIVTKDGVTVANHIFLEDQVENLGAKIIKEAASRTADEAGDGTTTSTVLAQCIYTEGQKMLSAGYQPDLIKQGIDLSLAAIKNNLFEMKKVVTKTEELKQVALISANGENDIANLIVSAIDSAGEDGNIIVEPAKGFKSELTVVDGFNLARGFLSPYFVTNKNKMLCEFNKPLILLANKEFNSIHDLMKPLEISLEAARPILVIANEISGDAMQGIVLNRVKGSLKVCAIKSPGFGNSRHDMLNDLQSVIGGKVITESFDMNSYSIDDFGSCEKVIISKNKTLIISKENNKNNDKINERILAIKDNLKESYKYDQPEIDLLNYRLSQLSGGIAILRVGGTTESELIERHDRVDDALHATRAAIQEGILPGGGVALVKCTDSLNILLSKEKDPDIKAGIQIMIRSIAKPFKQIIDNGMGSSESYIEKLMSSSMSTGYDARKNIFGDMYDLGIVDPHKVVRCAIENAVSAAGMLLSVGCCMIDVKQENLEDNYN
jgi:chaperonin GroEL